MRLHRTVLSLPTAESGIIHTLDSRHRLTPEVFAPIAHPTASIRHGGRNEEAEVE